MRARNPLWRTAASTLLALGLSACQAPAPEGDQAADSLPTAVLPTTDSGPAIPTVPTDSTAPDSVAPAPVAQEPVDTTVDERILAELRALSARVDSLAAAGAGPDVPEGQEDPEAEEEEPQLRFVGMRVFWTLVVLLTTALTVRSLAFVFDALAERNAERRLFYKRLVPLARLLSWIIAAVVVARVVWSVDAQGLLAAGAAGAVAIGFAAQDILKNVFGGLVIVADRPFAAGDKIRVGDTYGEVVSVGLWSTRITTPDDNLVSVPNSQVVNGQVANANAGALDCQVVTDLYVPGWVDERLAKKIAYEAAASSPFVYLNKPIVVLVRDRFEHTFVTNLKVKAYVLDQRYEFRFMSDVTERARDEFRKHGLLGPFHGATPVYRIDDPGGTAGAAQAGLDDGDRTEEAS